MTTSTSNGVAPAASNVAPATPPSGTIQVSAPVPNAGHLPIQPTAAVTTSPTSAKPSASAKSTITVPAAVPRRPWVIRQVGDQYEVDVQLPQRLPGGPVLPPACKGIAMRRSGAAIGGALLRATVNRHGPLVWISGKYLVYRSGAFRPIDDDELRGQLMSWIPIGKTKKAKLGMSRSLAGDALSCMRDMLAAPSTRFFESAPDGVAFTNVFVTVVDGIPVLLRHSPANRARHWIDVPYRRGATCRRFDRFLREVMMPACSPTTVGELFAAIAEAEAKIRAFWGWLGIALLGKATKYGKALLLWGPGGSGKSTLLMIVSKLWPDELRSSFALQAFEDKFNRAELAGKLLNVCGELPAADADVVETAKAIITGRDEIHARHPYERGFSFRAIAAHVIAANRLILVGDFTGAFFERFVVLRAEQKFRDTDGEDHDLADKIINTELAAIAAKAIRIGGEAIQRGRLTIPASSKTAISEWQALSDSVRAWFGELCESDAKFSDGGIAGGLVYRVYKVWAESRGYRPFSNNVFAEHMKAMGIAQKPSRYGTEWGLRWNDPVTVARMIPTITD